MKDRTIEELLCVLNECFEGEDSDGGVFLEAGDPGLFSMLHALDAEEASRSVAGMSIANHIYHLIFALDIFIQRISGNENATHVDWSTSWLEKSLNEPEWADLKKELTGLQEKTVSLVNACEVSCSTHLRLILGLLTHTVFHLGIVRMKFDLIKGQE
jgi:hypothetical protein